MISVVILAAGESTRMGQPKMLLPFSGSTIIETVVRTALASSADEVAVVLGAGADNVRGAVAHLPVSLALNTEYRLGMLSSIQCGVRSLRPDAGAAVIMLGDQPTIPVEVVDRVIDAWRSGGNSLVLPVMHGRRGHPLLVDLRLRDELLGLDHALGMRALVDAHESDLLEVEVDTPAVLKDVDTPEDYAGLTAG